MTMPDVAQEAMEALLALHSPDKIEIWNPEAPVNTFWELSSQVIVSISQKLIYHQITNYTDVLKWMKEILTCRNTFLRRHKEYANIGSYAAVCRESHIKLEVLFFVYLWSVDLEAVLTSLSCFGLLCEEVEIRNGSDECAAMMPNFHLYQELANVASTIQAPHIIKREDSKFPFYDQTQGRLLLQKKIMVLLRKISHCIDGVHPAWDHTFETWEQSCRYLQAYPKGKSEDSQEMFHRTIGKRRHSHQGTEHDLEDQINEWANMTWFLISLGGVCLDKPKLCRMPLSASQTGLTYNQVSCSFYSIASLSSARVNVNPSVVSAPTCPPEDVQNCPVTQ